MRSTLAVLVTFVIYVGEIHAAEPVRLTTDGGYKQHLQYSPDGTKLLLTRIHVGKMTVWTMASSGKELKELIPGHTMPYFDASWSPDGKRIAYVYDTLQGQDGKFQINTCAADGGDDKVFIPHKAFEEAPRWSPDGKTMLWVSTRDGNAELYTVDAEGKNQKRLTSEIAFDLHPAWSPNSKQIAFSSGRTGRQKLFTMLADGTKVVRITDGDFLDSWPVWSPDGKRIAYVSNRSGNFDIWLMNADGTAPKNLTAHPGQDTSPTWSPDGKSLAFVSNRSGGTDVYTIAVE